MTRVAQTLWRNVSKKDWFSRKILDLFTQTAPNWSDPKLAMHVSDGFISFQQDPQYSDFPFLSSNLTPIAALSDGSPKFTNVFCPRMIF